MSDGMGREFTYLSSHATNRYFIPNWGTVCLVGALLALASGKAERRQVHPLKLHLKSVGEYSAVNSVSSAYSVGEYSVINYVSSAYSVGDHSVKPSMKSCFFVQFR